METLFIFSLKLFSILYTMFILGIYINNVFNKRINTKIIIELKSIIIITVYITSIYSWFI